jgi:excinuclease ABC subunit A
VILCVETSNDLCANGNVILAMERDLKPVVLAVTIHEMNIMDICNLDIDNALELFKSGLKLDEQEKFIASQIVKEIIARLSFMNNVGLNYLELGRAANTLSGGEAQRIRLATQIGSGLAGCFICFGRTFNWFTPT